MALQGRVRKLVCAKGKKRNRTKGLQTGGDLPNGTAAADSWQSDTVSHRCIERKGKERKGNGRGETGVGLF